MKSHNMSNECATLHQLYIKQNCHLSSLKRTLSSSSTPQIPLPANVDIWGGTTNESLGTCLSGESIHLLTNYTYSFRFVCASAAAALLSLLNSILSGSIKYRKRKAPTNADDNNNNFPRDIHTSGLVLWLWNYLTYLGIELSNAISKAYLCSLSE